MLDDESDNDGSDSGFSGTCYFPLRFDDSNGCFSGLGYGVFVPTGVDSTCNLFPFVVLVLFGFDSKDGQIIKKLALKFLIIPPNFKISFIVIVTV